MGHFHTQKCLPDVYYTVWLNSLVHICAVCELFNHLGSNSLLSGGPVRNGVRKCSKLILHLRRERRSYVSKSHSFDSR